MPPLFCLVKRSTCEIGKQNLSCSFIRSHSKQVSSSHQWEHNHSPHNGLQTCPKRKEKIKKKKKRTSHTQRTKVLDWMVMVIRQLQVGQWEIKDGSEEKYRRWMPRFFMLPPYLIQVVSKAVCGHKCEMCPSQAAGVSHLGDELAWKTGEPTHWVGEHKCWMRTCSKVWTVYLVLTSYMC